MTAHKTKRLSLQSFTRKAGRVMLNIISILLACILILVGVLLAWSPGKPLSFVDENGKPLAGSIAEKIWVNINGIEQGMFIMSKAANNPVLLFVHGGPGMPEYWLTERYPTGLENEFTVVWWEQRGAGLSYRPDIPPETMTYEQFIADTLAVTNYLRNRFHQEKIYLMAHSGGSIFAIQVAARAPELYYAYIGMAQMVYGLKSEQLAHAYMLATFKENGNTAAVRLLEANPVTLTGPLPAAYDAVRDDYMHGLGIGTTRKMKSVITGVFLPSWLSRVYTLGEKINLWRGKFSSKRILWESAQSTDLTPKVTELKLPVYFFEGKYDYTCNYALAKSYFEQLKAPRKGFYTFENSAHTPLFEEPEKAQKILRADVLAGRNSLADR
jgi:pimeloyl-ACP methyl ester carboxylesterase